MHWHDQRVHQSMESRKVEHCDPLHRRPHHAYEHRDHHCDQLVHYGRQRSMEGSWWGKAEEEEGEQRAEQKKSNCYLELEGGDVKKTSMSMSMNNIVHTSNS